MEHSKWILVQVLMVGVALAQQHPDPYQLAQQIGARSTPFQQQQQQRNAPNFFQQQQQQQQQQQVAPSFAQQRPVTAFRTAPQAQSAFGRSQASGSTQTFGGGSETFMQITTRDQGASQQTRTVLAASQPAPQQNFFQQQRVAPPAPRPAPAQFPAPALTPTAFPAPAPAPVVLPNAVAAPVQQHDAQVFTRRPPPPPAPVTKQAQQFRQAPRPSQEFNANRLPAVVQDGTGFQPQPNEVQSFLPQQDPQAFQDGEDVFQQEVQRAPQVQQAPARQVTRNPEVRTRGPARHAAQLVDDSAPLRANPIRVAPAPVQVTTDDQGNPQEDDQLFREQAQNAHYTFASAVDDKLTDNSQVRQETRDGTNLKGLYSYSDGYFRRTVHYEADENGYRVTKEEVEPIGDGPVPDPTGSADVAAQFSGADYRYRITADDIRERKEERQASAQPVFSS